jgi:ATP-binding cassette, subfamily B, bacterial
LILFKLTGDQRPEGKFYMYESSHQTFEEAWKQRLKAVRNLPPLLRMVWASGPSVVAASLLFRLVAAVIPIAMLSVSRLIIDDVVALNAGRQLLPHVFWWLVTLEFALAGLGSILGRTVGFFDSLFADRFTRYVSVRVMDHASGLDLAAYEEPAFYDKLERARVQATDRVAMIREAGSLLQQAITALTLAASIFLFSPWLLVVLIVCLVPAFLGESHFAFLGYSLNIRQTPVRRQMDYLRVLGASKESAKELKLFGLKSFFVPRYSALSDQIYGQNKSLARRRLLAGSLLSVLSAAGYYGAYAYVIYRTVTGHQSVGTMTFLAGAIAGASTNIQNIFSAFSSIADQCLFLTDLMAFFGLQTKIRSGPLPAPRPIRDGFEFRDVNFSYPGAPRLLLDRLNFRLEPGERVALIGENGQGKTTIVKLITRLYDPTDGRILLDGVDLRDYSTEDLYREISVIFQDFMRYDISAAENIGVGSLAERLNLHKLQDAARKSLADSVIERLPDGYQQMLGRRFDGGVDLSGGEWQKIALARAYLRDAQLLVLDEPTASLDARSEGQVFQQFADLTDGKMALLISHRFSTVRMADRIVVLENGRIAEEGSHRRLVAMGGLYSGMFQLQAANYR